VAIVPLSSAVAFEVVVGGRPPLAWVLDAVCRVAQRVVVAPLIPVSAELVALIEARPEPVQIGPSRSNRAQAIRQAMDFAPGCETVLICDADRPLLDIQTLRLLLERSREGAVVLAATPVKATVKRAPAGFVEETLSRERMCYLRGERAFSRDLLSAILHLSAEDEIAAGREAGVRMVIEAVAGASVRVTGPASARLAEFLLEAGER
jgi:2-C-methyl-D-erythritol 4-phosphate cytidylyltransferase